MPTLTEVVEWRDTKSAQAEALDAVAAPSVPIDLLSADPLPTRSASASALSIDEQLVQRVLFDLQRQVDLMLDYRLREVITPLLTRAADNLVRDARNELASTLRDLVARAVALELSRHRLR